ncbi:hypothetical protein NC653_041374 [Populus alba x Populus x berolinensis]|uniref:Uncharacterized protein n=1 Tax=Populus alba x Populus x berolinensis TaxID=444605 RepID=A0AAD6L9T9_9ROSI|nr:hypothetical protein NC653_041374 [Populus alba x Populus x berolinensis]
MLFAGWFHYHKAAPKLAWFQDVESMLNHHLAGLLGLGSLFFTLNLSKYLEFLTFREGLDPVTRGLWLTDIAHHHLAIAILFLVAGHMYRTSSPYVCHAPLSISSCRLWYTTVIVHTSHVDWWISHSWCCCACSYFYGKRLRSDYSIQRYGSGGQGCFVTYSIRNRGFFVHHIHAFTIHVTGTISDQGVVTHITGGNFAQSSITINGWLRDFLWAQASQTCCRSNSLPSGWNCHNMGVLLSKNYCSRIMARRI